MFDGKSKRKNFKLEVHMYIFARQRVLPSALRKFRRQTLKILCFIHECAHAFREEQKYA